MQEKLTTWTSFLGDHAFTLGGTEVTWGGLLFAFGALFLLMIALHWLRIWVVRRLESTGHMDRGTVETIASLLNYILLVVGFAAVLNSVGVKLSSFAVLAGAFGVGVGFGLQNIFSNFISGLIVMFERPIKIGDHINIGGMEGDVVRIGMRATTLRSAQGSLIVVPNQTIITTNVINWLSESQGAAVLQFRIPADAASTENLLLEAVKNAPGVMQHPEPVGYVIAMDHASCTIEIHFRLVGDAMARLSTISTINRAVLQKFTQAGLTLAA